MTTDHQMATMYAAQQEVIVALTEVGDPDLADRLDRCMTGRRDRRRCGGGWPYSCRSVAGGGWRRALLRGGWHGMRQWSAAATSCLADRLVCWLARWRPAT